MSDQQWERPRDKTNHAKGRDEDERNADHVNGDVDRVMVVSTILDRAWLADSRYDIDVDSSAIKLEL